MPTILHPYPLISEGKVDTEKAKQMYMASPHVEWAPFCQTVNWPEKGSRAIFPVKMWILEKKENIARVASETIMDSMFQEKFEWHKAVLRTMRDYPKMHDTLSFIINTKLNELAVQINEDIKAKDANGNYKDEKYKPKFRARISDLTSLAVALKTVTESRHKSLLLHDWSIKLAPQMDLPKVGELDEQGKAEPQGFKLEVAGGNTLTAQDWERFFYQWVDKPALPAAVDIEAKSDGEE